MSLSSGLLPDTLVRSFAARGHSNLTPVQAAVLATPAAGRDLVVSAPTGSGKTLAYGLALAGQILAGDGRARPTVRPLALVVAPTRELAAQIATELGALYRDTGVRLACVTGATHPQADLRALRGAGLVIGTPGRLSDHLRRGHLDTQGLLALVLDEADDLIEGGFGLALERILAAVPDRARRHFVSATLSERVRTVARRCQRRPFHITIAPDGASAARRRLRAIAVPTRGLMEAVAWLVAPGEAGGGALVFCNRREGVSALSDHLESTGLAVARLSGALAHRDRRRALSDLRGGRVRVCVATDLAARGLVFPKLALVVHAGLPVSAASLLHRCGRGQGGAGVLVVARHDRRRAEALARRAGFSLDWD